jgi:hypothetical protein
MCTACTDVLPRENIRSSTGSHLARPLILVQIILNPSLKDKQILKDKIKHVLLISTNVLPRQKTSTSSYAAKLVLSVYLACADVLPWEIPSL